MTGFVDDQVRLFGEASFVFFSRFDINLSIWYSVIADLKDGCTTFFLVTISSLSSIFEILSCPCEKNMIRDGSTVVIPGGESMLANGDSWW